MDTYEKIIRDNCWKFDKGYPDSQEDINYLKTLIEQEIETVDVNSIVPGDTSGEEQEKVVDVIKENPSQVDKVKSNPKLIGWFVGQVMKKSEGKADPKISNKIVNEKLK